MRDPDVLLLLPLLARPHRHAPILGTKSVDTSEVFVCESGLAPRAAKPPAGTSQTKYRAYLIDVFGCSRAIISGFDSWRGTPPALLGSPRNLHPWATKQFRCVPFTRYLTSPKFDYLQI